jgi:hypothetical protein
MCVQPEGKCLFRVENRGKPLGGYVVGTKHREKDGRWCVRCGVSVLLASFVLFFSGRFLPFFATSYTSITMAVSCRKDWKCPCRDRDMCFLHCRCCESTCSSCVLSCLVAYQFPLQL